MTPVAPGDAPASAFCDDLERRVAEHFRQRQVARHGGAAGLGYAISLVVAMVGLHALALSDEVHGVAFFGVQLGLGLLCYLFAVGVAHEATHRTLCGYPRVNGLFVRLFDLVVLSSFVWTHDHVKCHHAALNVVGRDNALNTGGLLRFGEDEVHRPWHRYQHLYAWALYGGASLVRWFVNDWARLGRLARGSAPVRMSLPERAWFLLGIGVRNALFLVLPAALTTVPIAQIVSGFLAMHVLMSVPLVISVQLSHLFDGTELFREGDLARLGPDAVVRVTSDFSPRSLLVTFLTGGHNLHTVHHLFDDIHHRHFIGINQVLRRCARDHGVELVQRPTPWGAVAAHYRLLRRLAQVSPSSA